jgi:hypothetical protein
MSGVTPTASDPDLEREKWRAELRLRERELSLREEELCFKNREVQRSRWANPLVLAVLAAALAAAGNAAVAYINGAAQRELEVARTKTQETIEETKAEAARILEVIKTEPKVALQNLAFLCDVGLIKNPERVAAITEYIKKTPPGKGPSLKAVGYNPRVALAESLTLDLESARLRQEARQLERQLEEFTASGMVPKELLENIRAANKAHDEADRTLEKHRKEFSKAIEGLK